MSRKDRNVAKLLDFLGDPENEFVSRAELSMKVLGYSASETIYRLLTPAELDDIESEAIEIRKARSARQRSHVYAALYRKAKSGNVPAAKEWLERIEGKVTDKVKFDGTVSLSSILDSLDGKTRGLPSD